MKNILALSGLIAVLTSLGCSSCKKNITDPNGLPSATQNGAKTLGFLLNGQPWTPHGFNGAANLSMDIDFGYQNGIFGVAAYRIVSTTNSLSFGIGISDSLNFMKVPINLAIGKNTLAQICLLTQDSCSIDYYDQTVYRNGNLTITKLDKTSRIISGTFDATLYKSGCDTIKITDGRFDMSY